MEREELIECIYEEYQQFVYRTAYQILQDEQLSEDTVHECVIRLYKAKVLNIDSVSSPSTKSLIRIIARNEANRIYSKQKKERNFTDTISNLQLDDQHCHVYMEIEDILNRMNPIYRDVIILRCYYGYDYKQVGKLLGIHTQTAYNRMVTVRKLLRKYWNGGMLP